MATGCINHNYKTYFMLPDDFLMIAKAFFIQRDLPESQAQAFGSCLHALELRTNERLQELRERGIAEEQTTEDMLWLDIEWRNLSDVILGMFGVATLQKVFLKVEEAGFVRNRYVRRGTQGEVVAYATYEAARLDKDKKHSGKIVHQALFLYEQVNREIHGGRQQGLSDPQIKREAAQRSFSETPGLDTHAEQPSKEHKQVAQGGNLIADSSNSFGETIPPLYKKEKGVSTSIAQNSQKPSANEEGATSW